MKFSFKRENPILAPESTNFWAFWNFDWCYFKLKFSTPKQRNSIMGSPKVQGTKIGTLRSDNWIFSFEIELHQKLLLQSISTLIRPSLNIILTESLVTCTKVGNYFAYRTECRSSNRTVNGKGKGNCPLTISL